MANTVKPESIGAALGFGVRVSEQQKKDADAIAKLIIERRAKYDPYVGRKFKSKSEEIGGRPSEITIVEFIPAFPMSGSVVAAFRVSRLPIPAVWFADAEEFLRANDEIIATVTSGDATESQPPAD